MLLFALAAWAECPPALREPAALDAALEQAGRAIDALDPASLVASADAIDAAVRCREAPILVGQAADVHRLLGVVAFVGGDEAASQLWFGASRALNPAAPLGHAIGGPIESAWARALPSSPPDRAPMPEPRQGTLRVDGQLLTTRPAHLPYVVQLEQDGRVVLSALQSAGTTPDYPFRGPDPDAPVRRRRTWTVATGAAALLSVAALSGAAATRATFRDLDTPDDRAASLIPVNRALGIGGYALGAAALGLGGVALAVEW